MTPELGEQLGEFFALVQMVLEAMGVWDLLMIFLAAILIIRVAFYFFHRVGT